MNEKALLTEREQLYCSRAAARMAATDQSWIESRPSPAFAREPSGPCAVVTHTVAFSDQDAELGIVVGRDSQGCLFLATASGDDSATIEALLDDGLDL